MNRLPFFQRGHRGGIKFDQGLENSHLFLLSGFLFFVLLSFLGLSLRLFQLTIVKGAYYRQLSEQNRIRELILEAKRGTIIDRKGFIIAENIAPDNKKNDERMASRRIYHLPEAIAHIIGYRQTADANDLKNDPCLNKLDLGDKTGKKGVEKLFDCQLRGYHGKKLIEVDAKGKYLKTLSIVMPQEGDKIQLALDLDLQNKTYEMIKDKKAAVVAVKPQTGEILVFASSPSFNPQDFEDNNSQKIDQYLTDKNKPLFDRISEAAYPPGSIFKIALAAGALEEKKIDDKTVFEDTGVITAGPAKFGNWYFLQYGKTEGMVDITKAIQRSNDIFFYRVGQLLGPDRIKSWAEEFGYGQPTGFGLNETEGLLPSTFWKEETLKESWYLGDTYNYAIGQGYTLVTPLQTVAATASVANNGYLCQPQFLKNPKSKCRKLPLSQNTLNLIHKGMVEACAPGGTGWPFFQFGIMKKQPSLKTATQSAVITGLADSGDATASGLFQPISVACKTGTAESHVPSGISHAWFTVYAPSENPEIALSIIIEEGGQGSDVAGPIARDILKEYFGRSE
ncbi:hypothetical protein GYA28_02130 [Candidatus Roizmanbacteria bacterium]|nr:hypothetical protein [Candidatus Roizmanbacteria bacterium]